MTLKVIHRLQTFSHAIRRTFVQHFTRFQLTVCSHGSSGLAEPLVTTNRECICTALLQCIAATESTSVRRSQCYENVTCCVFLGALSTRGWRLCPLLGYSVSGWADYGNRSAPPCRIAGASDTALHMRIHLMTTLQHPSDSATSNRMPLVSCNNESACVKIAWMDNLHKTARIRRNLHRNSA